MDKITFEELCDNVNVEMLKDMVNECNGWNDSLEEYYMYEFDEYFFKMFFNGNIIEAVRATFFGNIQNWYDEYIHFNAYGNLESMSSYEYDNMLDENKTEIIETALELYQEGHLNLYDEITELFDKYLQEEDNEECDYNCIYCSINDTCSRCEYTEEELIK